MSFEDAASVFFVSENAFELFVFVFCLSLFPFLVFGFAHSSGFLIEALVKRFIYPGKKQPFDQEAK